MPRPEPCPHPYPAKLSFVIAEDVRRLRRAGASVKSIAKRYGVAPSSISAVLKLHVYAPPEVIAVGLETSQRAVLRELAKEDELSDEQLAGDLIVRGMDRRIAREVGVRYEEIPEPRRRRRH
jgi:lambda repressor-like predicted transcriptional regulator